MVALTEINAADSSRFVALLGDVFEHSPWVAQRIAEDRPFESVDDLHLAMFDVVLKASLDELLALIRAHPELAGREAVAGTMTADSSSEQGRLGLTSLSRPEFERITQLNRDYQDKFGFPCIVALTGHQTRETVLREMEHRLVNDRDTEVANALVQIGHITRARLKNLVEAS